MPKQKSPKKPERVIEEWMVPIPAFENSEIYADIGITDNQVCRVLKVHCVFTDPTEDVQEQSRALVSVPTILEKQIIEVLNQEHLDEILEFIKEEEEEEAEEAELKAACSL